MQANREQFSMHAMCTALRVSRSGYYAWCVRDKSPCLLNQANTRLRARFLFVLTNLKTLKRRLGG